MPANRPLTSGHCEPGGRGASQFIWRRWSTGQASRGVPKASAVLFLAQASGFELDAIDQLIIVLTTLVASVGAGSIPSGSFVTLPLIFAAVGLPPDKIPVLPTVDWFLDRCRTTSNVLGDMTVAVLLDRTASAKPSLSSGGPEEL